MCGVPMSVREKTLVPCEERTDFSGNYRKARSKGYNVTR